MTKDWNTRTKLVHAGTRRSQYNEVSEAIFLTQGFVYDTAEQAEARFIETGEDEFIYARYGNPTVRMFEERIAALEGAEDAFATASGMAAVNGALVSMLKTGDHVVSARALFGSCLYILEEILGRYGVEITLVDGTNLDEWKAAVRPDTKAVFLEAISNPTLEVADIRGISDIAHAVGALVVVDNVFATPIFQKSLNLGADVIIYSATKHIDGQGRVLGGVVLGTKDFIRSTLEPYMKHTGGSMSPFTAWVLLKGLETLDLRCQAQANTARALADALKDHPALSKVIYPGLPDHPNHALAASQMDTGGTMLAIEVKGGRDAAFQVLNALEVFIISNNLGDAKSIITHPATTTHQRLPDEQKEILGISPGLIRISCGLEDSADLIADLTNALDGLGQS
ncbi:O-succinylhomoserine sulfhydrylase [Qingshengfaniella alkalisoli]|uniref:O-succinylhomoserine sulfhydrylase n=1 Tax=Qingshengfaniella alkalisoli TaxID=2599296 RepID=A0A5B8IX40_9RHOB|nr:O-succinylhomoserine sulfhydrylase [Qingshengfaniella alkalisoli]QDY69128.1 O-succinylhomoserine sulfhydrylase [Qingshengfaniella alkalisoli]